MTNPRPLLSVVMAHYRREELLYRTLWGYRHLHTPEELGDVEFVIVDDDGGVSKAFWKVIEFHGRALKITAAAMSEKTKSGEKTHNASGPMNLGFKLATGDLFVLTNPENIPTVPRLLTTTRKLMLKCPKRYLTGACYSMGSSDTSIFSDIDCRDKTAFIEALQRTMPWENRKWGYNGASSGWIQHSRYNFFRFYFLAAIWREPLFKIRGFDEDYMKGQSSEDDDLLYRVKRLGMEMFHTDELIVLHQYHYGEGCHKLKLDRGAKVSINHKLLAEKRGKSIKRNLDREWGAPGSVCKVSKWHECAKEGA